MVMTAYGKSLTLLCLYVPQLVAQQDAARVPRQFTSPEVLKESAATRREVIGSPMSCDDAILPQSPDAAAGGIYDGQPQYVEHLGDAFEVYCDPRN